MAQSVLEAPRRIKLDRLLTGGVGVEEAAVEYAWHGPNGSKLRYTYVLRQFAEQVCNGDYQRAAEIMEWPLPALGHSSPREAAQTDRGMLGIRAAIREMISLRDRRNGSEHCYFFNETKQQDCTLVLDLLPLAWGLTDQEFAFLLGTPLAWLDQWRSEGIVVEESLMRRVVRLRSFHEALRAAADPRDYSSAWRRVWPHESPLGKRSLLQAVLDDGDVALDRFENFLWICLSSL